MKRPTTGISLSVRFLPFCTRGLLACAVAVLAGACGGVPLDAETPLEGDRGGASPTAPQPGGTGGQGGAAAPGPVAVDPNAKIDSRLLADATADDQTRDVIAMLDTQVLPAIPSTEANADPASPSHISTIATQLDAVKTRISDRLLARFGTTVLDRYSNLPALHVRVASKVALIALAADPDVARVVPNEMHALLDTVPANLTLINQPKAASAGKLGAGTTVAVLDTGADYKRAPFNCASAGAAGCPIVYAADFAPQDNNVDDNGHGTNVSGVINAVAPAAGIAALDVFAGSGAATSDIMAAINWTIQNKAKYNIVAINMSLGSSLSTVPCPGDALAVSIASARAAGILSAVASGNAGTLNAISSPACGPDAVSVGAVHAANLGSVQWSACGDATTKPDQVACFSCSSSFLTVLAPGVMITAAGITMSGTSQATPHVAGAIAVLRSAFPSETPTAIVARLTSYGVPVKDARNGITKPRIDLWASLNGMAAAPAPAAGPTGTIALNANATATKTAVVSVALTTTSGTASQVCLSEGTTCTTWVPAASTLSFTLSAGDGTKTVRALWKDAMGNVSASPAAASILLDTTAPSDGALTATAAGFQASFIWSGFSDAGSGLNGYRLVTGTSGAIAAGCMTGSVAYAGNDTSFAQTFTAAGTIYARLCASDAVGNMSAGRPITVVLTAPAAGTHAVVLAGSDNTTQVGNPAGGTPYNDACPAGQVLIGFGGSLSVATTAAVNRQISGHCGVLQIAGTAVSVKAGLTLTTRGNAGTSPWTRDCPANQVVVGFAGRSGLLVDQIVLSCAPLTASKSTSGSALTVGAATSLAPVGGTGGTAFTAVKCLAGEIATMARVRTGDNMDAFGLACSTAAVGP